MGWGLALTLVFTGLYALWGSDFLRVFSDKPDVIEATRPYLFWVLIIPVCGFSAFLFDGIFVGATASRTMRNSMFIATAAFFLIYYALTPLLQAETDFQRNNMLWTAFMVYLGARGIGQAIMLRQSVYSKTP